LGWEGRLNGPVDNPESSCLSCHATASLPQYERVPPGDLQPEKKKFWFRNFKVDVAGGEPFWPGTETLDYSLQLSSGIRNFYQANDGKSECRPEGPKRNSKLRDPKEQIIRY
jgi:hypothetical protein